MWGPHAPFPHPSHSNQPDAPVGGRRQIPIRAAPPPRRCSAIHGRRLRTASIRGGRDALLPIRGGRIHSASIRAGPDAVPPRSATRFLRPATPYSLRPTASAGWSPCPALCALRPAPGGRPALLLASAEWSPCPDLCALRPVLCGCPSRDTLASGIAASAATVLR